VLDRKIVSKQDDGSYILRYEHFSLVMHKTRRLALYTASNVDAAPGRKKPEPGRDYTRKGLTGLGDHDRRSGSSTRASRPSTNSQTASSPRIARRSTKGTS
jgi:hypothetical protein